MYFIVYKNTVHIPGDERSIKYPGHGRPAHDKEFEVIERFDTLDAVKEWIANNEKYVFAKAKYELFEVIPLQVKTTMEIKVDVQ